jgi:hypothetical protein
MSLFKYLEAVWADALVNRGSIRIGTLYGFRDAENLDAERADKLEGVRQYVGPAEFISSRDEAATAYLAKQGAVFEGCTLINETRGPAFMNEVGSKDCYIYCMSNTFNETNCAAMGGACIEIVDGKFFDCIGEHLLAKGLVKEHGIVADCVYGEKTEHFTRDRPGRPTGWLVKSKRYAHQTEVRAMWKPTKKTDEYGSIKSSFYKYVTLDPEPIEVEALIRSPYVRRIR